MPLRLLLDRGQKVLVNWRGDSLQVATAEIPVAYFDPAGRLIGAYLGGSHYRRGLDNRLVERWGRLEGGRWRREIREVPPSEARALVGRISASLEGIASTLERGGHALEEPVEPLQLEAARLACRRAASFTFETLEGDARKFRAVYGRIAILPPDQYRALVLQATVGCSYRSCLFCEFYGGRDFAIRTEAEFREHIALVREFFGPALALRRTLFLGDGNALAVPQEALLRFLGLAVGEFPALAGAALSPGPAGGSGTGRGLTPPGVYAFADAASALEKSPREWRALARAGLRRAYIGLESGDEQLLRFLRKPASAAQAVRAVKRIRGAGVAVGVIVLVGAGGRSAADAHLSGTVRALNAMALGVGDILYLSDLIAALHSPYSRRAREEGMVPLTAEEMEGQRAAIVGGLRFAGPPPRIAAYDIREFLY